MSDRTYSTNYQNALITSSADSKATTGIVPTKEGTIAQLQLDLMLNRPYALTSDDLLFEVHAIRNRIPAAERERAREQFFAKPLACLRTSPLVKQFGWGIHHDAEGRIAAIPVDSEKYRDLADSPEIQCYAGMRSSRKS